MQENMDELKEDVDEEVYEKYSGGSPDSISKVKTRLQEPMTAQPRFLARGNDLSGSLKQGLKIQLAHAQEDSDALNSPDVVFRNIKFKKKQYLTK